MKHCAVVKRMKSACPVMKSRKLSSKISSLEAEMDEIAKLLVKCCNDYIMNGDADGLKYMSEIDAVKTFLPAPETYRDVIVSSWTNPFYNPANPEFYKFEMIRVVEGTVIFKSLFSLKAAGESVEKFVVLKVGQRAALILVSLARIALMQSRFHTALACCRVGLILVRLLNNISSARLWTAHKVLQFLLGAEAVECCTFLAAFDHLFCCSCAEIMDSAVLAYHDFLNIFRSYGDGLTKSEEDLMLSDGESLAEIRTIVGKLSTQLVDWSAGNDLLFNFSMFYFHMARKDVAALKSADLSTVPPRDENFHLCVRGFLDHPDTYMLAAAIFSRGCFRSASCHKGLNQDRTKSLMSAESDLLNVLSNLNTYQSYGTSVPWVRLMEKASIASLVTRCRILVRCAATFDVDHFRNSLNNLYSLARTPLSNRLEDGISSSRNVSAVASLAFLYLTDHTLGAPDVFEGSAKASVSRRRAECASLSSQLLEDEATLSFCLKVFCDLTQELLGGEEVFSNGKTQFRRCLHRLQLLSMPIFAAVSRSGSSIKRISVPEARDNEAKSPCPIDQNIRDDVTRSTGLCQQICDNPSSNREPNSGNAAFSDGNIDNWRESQMNDLVLNTHSQFNCRNQAMNSTNNHPIELQVVYAQSSEPYHVLAVDDTIHSKPNKLKETLKVGIDSVPPGVSQALDDFVTAVLDRGFDILCRRTVPHNAKNVCQTTPPAGGISSTANEWVAVFPQNLEFPAEGGLLNVKSKSVSALEVEHLCVTQLSRIMKEAAVVLERNMKDKSCDNSVSIVQTHPASQKVIQYGQDEGVKLKFRNPACKLPDDTESWLAFLRRSSLLTTVEDSLEDLFIIDGTDNLMILKSAIAKDLQMLCRATVGNHGSLSSDNPAYLSVFAHCAYTTALQHLKLTSDLAEFDVLLRALFDALDENPFGSADRWDVNVE